MFDRPADDAGYFHTRALEEQVAAQRATSDEARERHDELAAMYRFRERFYQTAPPASPEEIEQSTLTQTCA